MRLLRRHCCLSFGDDRGQGLVEFALLAPLFFMLVVGFVQFAIGLNFWLDMQRLANQGARSAVVNCGPTAAKQCGSNLASSLVQQVISSGNSPSVEVCYVPPSDPAPNNWKPNVGDDVRVTLKETYGLQLIANIAAIPLTARVTARLEQTPTSSALPSRDDSTYYVLSSHSSSQPCRP